MTYRTKRGWRLALLPATLAVAIGGCAVDAVDTSRDSETPGRLITQNAPAPEYTVFYRDALRACLQTGRSAWECKTGEDRFVRDALAVEAELSAQRKQRRQDRLERAELRRDDSADTSSQGPAITQQSRSLMFEQPPESQSSVVPPQIPTSLNLGRSTGDATATTR